MWETVYVFPVCLFLSARQVLRLIVTVLVTTWECERFDCILPCSMVYCLYRLLHVPCHHNVAVHRVVSLFASRHHHCTALVDLRNYLIPASLLKPPWHRIKRSGTPIACANDAPPERKLLRPLLDVSNAAAVNACHKFSSSAIGYLLHVPSFVLDNFAISSRRWCQWR